MFTRQSNLTLQGVYMAMNGTVKYIVLWLVICGKSKNVQGGGGGGGA
jgi:hypothetical protein